MNRKP